jgi:uncharacterized protein YbjT (DUF2867 family)
MYVLMGANGNITSKTARALLAQGRPVRVVGRNAEHLQRLRGGRAETAAGDAADVAFLSRAFRGASAVYAMIPPNYASPDMRAHQSRVGEAIAGAVAESGVTRVVNLSSGGAHLASGTGPIAGLHEQEERLNQLAGVDVLHLRPGYFFENHLHAAGLIMALDVYPSMEKSDVPVAMIATQDIAAVVARELQAAADAKHGVLHLRAKRLYSMQEAAAILGAAIGKPGLKHVQADPAQAKAGMVQHGFSQNVADSFEEMAAALSDGRISAGFGQGPLELTPTSLEDFSAVFAQVYKTL